MISRLYPRHLATLLVSLALLAIFTSCKAGSASTSLPSGEWTATADFGRFTFVVSPGSKSITDITFDFVALDVCGAVSSGSIQVGFGSPIPITKRAFSIETSIGGGAPSLPPMPGQISIPSVPDTMKITGMFGEDNVSASGTWSALQGGTMPCSNGDWTAVPNEN